MHRGRGPHPVVRWWLQAHRAHVPAVAVVAVSVLAWLAAEGAAFDGAVASPVKIGVAVPLVLWAPIAIVASTCAALAVDGGRLDRTTTARSNARLSAALVAAVLVALLVGCAPAVLVGGRATVAVLRDAAGLVGVALVLRRRFNEAAASAIVATYFVACALLGAEPNGQADWWAWPVDAVGIPDLLVAAGLLAVGLAVTMGSAPASLASGLGGRERKRRELRRVRAAGTLDRPTRMGMRERRAVLPQAVSVRLDDDTLRALRIIEATGLSRSDAIRAAIIGQAGRLRQRDSLAAEAAALDADEDDLRETRAILAMMEDVREPW